MSDPPSVDLSDLNFMPEWLKGPSGKQPPAHDQPRDRKGGSDSGGGGGKGRGGKGGGRRDNFQGGEGRGGDRRGGGGKGGDRRGRNDRGGYERKPAPTPPPPKGVVATLEPAHTAVHQIAEQIKKTARAYPVFDVARLMLAARDRYCVVFKRDGDGAPELFSCSADNSAWLSRAEAAAHLPLTAAFAEHYDAETIQGDPPKGNYTAIAICGMSDTLIGPPNHHSYQSEIARLHRERFSNMSLDRYKSRIRIERDEETIEKWKTEQSVQRHFTYKRAPEGEAPPKFDSREAAGKHFIEHHADAMVSAAPAVTVSGNIPGRCLSPGLLTLLREVSENTHRHPATLVQPLCRMLGAENLKFFKRGRKIFAALTRPKPLDDHNGLSAPILAIIELLRANKRANVETLLAVLTPTPPPEIPPAPADEKTAQEPEPKAPETLADTNDATTDEAKPATESKAEPAAEDKVEAKVEATTEPKPELTPAQIKVLQDLRWLLHEGAVIAFGDGHIELATPKTQPENRPKSPHRKKRTKVPAAAKPQAEPTPEPAPEPAPEAPATTTTETPTPPPAKPAAE